MLKLLKGIRAKETSYAIRMARIRAMNMALYFFITPLVSFIVFTVVSSVAWSCAFVHGSTTMPEVNAHEMPLGIVHTHSSTAVLKSWFCALSFSWVTYTHHKVVAPQQLTLMLWHAYQAAVPQEQDSLQGTVLHLANNSHHIPF